MGSALDQRSGKIALATIVIICFAVSTSASRDWITGHPIVMLVGMAVGLAIYIPTLAALWFFDRRDREPPLLVILVIASVICVFAPLAAVGNDWMGQYLPLFVFVGFNEELAKVAPLVLLILFMPRAVNGTRDGLIYGALGGLGFAIVEFGYYVAYKGFDEHGWAAIGDQIGRSNLLGTHNHVLWSAALGSAIGWAARATPGWKRIIVPLMSYIGLALNHSLEDAGGNAASAMLGGVLLEPILLSFPNPEATMQAHMTLIQILFGTVNVLMINIFVLPILFVVLRRSGETERRIIREQLQVEDQSVISSDALHGAQQDRRLRSRTISGLSRKSSNAIVQLQNELAFHKDRLSTGGANVNFDPAVAELRELLKRNDSVRSPQ
jgi:protease PrsW